MMSSYKHIECLTTQRRGVEIIEKLEALGIFTANRSFAKGSTASSPDPIEVEVISVMVEEERSEEIFEYLFYELELSEPHNGIIYQTSIRQLTPYRLPSEAEIEMLNKELHK